MIALFEQNTPRMLDDIRGSVLRRGAGDLARSAHAFGASFFFAIAPVVVAFIAERTSDPMALATVAAFGALSLVCFSLVRRPT